MTSLRLKINFIRDTYGIFNRFGFFDLGPRPSYKLQSPTAAVQKKIVDISRAKDAYNKIKFDINQYRAIDRLFALSGVTGRWNLRENLTIKSTIIVVFLRRIRIFFFFNYQ